MINVIASHKLLKRPIENLDSFKPEQPNDKIEKRYFLLHRFNESHVQILPHELEGNTRKPCSRSNVEQGRSVLYLLDSQTGKRIDEVLDDDFFSGIDTGQVNRSIPYLQLFKIDHELFQLFWLEMNTKACGVGVE